MVAVNDLLSRDAFLFCSDGYGNPVLIGTAHEHHLLLLQTKVSHIDIGRYVNSCKMTYVYSAICIWQCCGYCSAFFVSDLMCFFFRCAKLVHFFHI